MIKYWREWRAWVAMKKLRDQEQLISDIKDLIKDADPYRGRMRALIIIGMVQKYERGIR